jgi:hypothetical protein
VTGPSLKQAIAWTLVAAMIVLVAATMMMAVAPDVALAQSDTSKKVGDEAKGWLTVLFLVAGFAALPVIGRLDVGRGFALAALVLIPGGLAFAQGDVRSAIDSIWSSIG